MFGSVLCSPGCFSLYRNQAVREVLPTYASNVDHAFEFLTKDMGWCPNTILSERQDEITTLKTNDINIKGVHH